MVSGAVAVSGGDFGGANQPGDEAVFMNNCLNFLVFLFVAIFVVSLTFEVLRMKRMAEDDLSGS